jgi:tRNA nucleotidyltransferase/poly(A) polymerase
MLAPFSDDPGNSGIPRRRAEDEMIKMIVERDSRQAFKSVFMPLVIKRIGLL